MPQTTSPTPAAAPAAASPLPAQSPATTPDASEHLEHRLVSRWNDLLSALHDKNFYLEVALVSLTVVLAVIIARIIMRQINRHLALHPPKFIDSVFLTKPLQMVTPSLVIVALWFMRGIIVDIGLTGNLALGITELAYAYWLMKVIQLSIPSRGVAMTISAAIMINALLRAARIEHSTSSFLESIGFDVGSYHITALHLVNGFVIFTVVFWGAGLLSRTFESILRRSTNLTPNSLHLALKIFKGSLYAAAFLTTLSAVGIDLTAFAIFSGAVGVGIGLGLQKLAGNFVSGFTVLIERSIRIGDLIEVGGNSGWVRQLNVRYVLLETADGREVLIPNEELMSSRVTNWTLTTPRARIDVDITVGYANDAQKIRNLLMDAARANSRCLKDPGPSCVLKEFAEKGLLFSLSFWISDVTEGRNNVKSEVMLKIVEQLAVNNIKLGE